MKQSNLLLPDSDVDSTIQVSIPKLLARYPDAHPFETQIWGDFILNKENVLAYVRDKQFMKKPLPYHDPYFINSAAALAKHEMRVAHLVATGWTDLIEIDVGVPNFGLYINAPVLDGNHRLAAAIVRGDTRILASCAGDVALIDDLI